MHRSSSGLGHRPFTAGTRVRISYDVPIRKYGRVGELRRTVNPFCNGELVRIQLLPPSLCGVSHGVTKGVDLPEVNAKMRTYLYTT